MSIVLITGTDGCGKTTAATALAERLRSDGVNCRYFYGRHFAVFLLPLRLAARFTALRGRDQFGDYRRYMTRKTEVRSRWPWLAGLYGALWMLDYILVTTVRLLPLLFARRLVIVDRYVTDVAVNVAVNASTPERASILLERGQRFMPEPILQILLDVEPEVAFSRKDDVPSLQYLEERRGLYRQLWEERGWPVIDGGKPVETVHKEVLELIHMRLKGGKSNDPERRPASERTVA